MTDIEARLRAVPRLIHDDGDHVLPDYPALAAVVQGMLDDLATKIADEEITSLLSTLAEQAREIERLREALDHTEQWFMQMANDDTLRATKDLREHIAAALRATPEAGA